MGDSKRLQELYAAGDHAAAWQVYAELAETGQAGASDHLVGALSAWRQRQLWPAKRAIEAAVAAGPDGGTLGKVRFTAGHIYREIGDLHLAREYHDALMSEWDAYPQIRPLLEGPAWHNLGLVHYQRREYGEAVLCCDQACSEFRREGMQDYLRQSLQNRAWALCWLGDAAGARVALGEAAGLITSQPAHWQQEIGMAFLTFCEQDHEECQRLTLAIVESRQAPTDVLSHAAWLNGRSHLARGMIKEAVFMANAAVQWATEAQDSRCMSDAQRLLRDCHIAAQTEGA